MPPSLIKRLRWDFLGMYATTALTGAASLCVLLKDCSVCAMRPPTARLTCWLCQAEARQAPSARGQAQRASFDNALADARRAMELAPDLGEAHLALARVFEDGLFDFARASDEYSRAVSLAPGNARVLQRYGNFAANMGHTEAGLAASRRAVILDPLSTESHRKLAEGQWVSRRYAESVAGFEEIITLDPEGSRFYAWCGLAYSGLGNLQSALASCDSDRGGGERGWTLFCLALLYDRLESCSDRYREGR
jgi:tetratricopeptide (TPR) repeat protein